MSWERTWDESLPNLAQYQGQAERSVVLLDGHCIDDPPLIWDLPC